MRIVITAFTIGFPAIAFAGTRLVVPEPETLSLLAVGAIALLVARWRMRK